VDHTIKKGSSVGIFKKILKKKEKGAVPSPEKKATPKKKASPGFADPLAPLGAENEVTSPPPQSQAPQSKKILQDSEAREGYEWEPQGKKIRPSAPAWEEAAQEERRIPEPVSSEISDSTSGPVQRKVREAERGLAEMERTLAEAAFLFKGTETLPRLKILIVEAKIKLAEADIKLSEAEIAPRESPSDIGEIESRITLAEAKIGEAERILASLPVPGPGKGSLSRLKIAMAGMKIRLAETQIALAGSSLEGMPVPPPPPPGQKEPLRSPSPTYRDLSRQGGPIQMEKEVGQDLVRLDPSAEAKIHLENEERLPLPEPLLEPVRIKDEDWKPVSPPAEQSERIVLPDMEGDPSPFETGINMNRVRIPNGDQEKPDLPSAVQEPVKIRSDERESAWVTEDGSLKIVSREETGAGHAGEDEKPHISIRQPEVEKALVIEELNRKGIEQRKKGDLEGALQSFDQVLQLDPDNVATLHNKGVALRTAGRYEEALACFDRAQERDPDNAVIWFNRGFCLGKLERYEEALKAFDRVLALNPEHTSGWYNKGKILQKMGRTEEAEEHLKKAKELGNGKGSYPK
jgi:tetratricopeptide (TPR) repeat protein